MLNKTPGRTQRPEVFAVAASDEGTALVADAVNPKTTFYTWRKLTLESLSASLTTVSSSGSVTVEIKKNGTTIFSSVLTITASNLTSTTYTLTAKTSFASGDKIEIFVTGAGTGATGLKVYFTWHQ